MAPQNDFVDPNIKELHDRLNQNQKFKRQLQLAKDSFDFILLRGQEWSVPILHSDGIYSVSFQLTSDGRTLTCHKIVLEQVKKKENLDKID